MKNSTELLDKYQRSNLETKLLIDLEKSLENEKFLEFVSKDFKIYAYYDGKIDSYTIDQLLPEAFNL